MDTTWRSITERSKSSLERLGWLLLGPAILVAWADPFYGQATGISAGALSSISSNGGAATTSTAARFGAEANGAPVVLPADFSELRVEAGDLLSVSVYDTPELSDAYRVDAGGDLALPLCGKLHVQGLTSVEAATAIAAKLESGQILNQPQVTVDVRQYAGHYVTVLGEVINPGRVTLIAPERLSDILAQAGGLTPVAGARIKIRHGPEDATPEQDEPYSRSESNRQSGSVLIRPGDTVVVPRAGIIYVLGAVYHPGGYLMQEDGKLNVAQALAMSGGTLLTAKTEGLRVVRRKPDGSILDFALSYDQVTRGTQTPLALESQDIVYVPMSKVKATLTDATAILSAATSAAIYTAH